MTQTVTPSVAPDSARPQVSGYGHPTPAFRTYSGPRALDSLRRELDRNRLERAVVVGSPSVFRHREVIDRLRTALQGRLVGEFTEVQEHSPVPAVEQARDLLAATRADVVIAVGGGSAVVTARAAVILLAEQQDVRALCTRRGDDGRMISPRLNAPKLPIWVVPTTPTTAYAKAGSAVRDPRTGERLPLYDPKTRAAGVIFDPDLAATAPASLVTSASLNALSLAVEGLQAEGADPLADALLAHALRLALTWIPRVDDTSEDATQADRQAQTRLNLMAAALLSGQGSDFARGGLAQGLSHIIGPRSTVANGVVEAMLLPAATRLDAALSGVRTYPLLAQVLGSPSDSVTDVANALADVLHRFGVPGRLREVGIERTDLPDLVQHALGDWSIASRPHPPSADDLLTLLTASW